EPSEVAPLTSLLMAEMLAECGLPEDVFQVATGAGETGAALVDEVDMVMFTGSVRTGKKVMAQAAETLTPVSLELGGKDPMLVLADADIERAAMPPSPTACRTRARSASRSSGSTSRSRSTTSSSTG